jgi:hypothetical protein
MDIEKEGEARGLRLQAQYLKIVSMPPSPNRRRCRFQPVLISSCLLQKLRRVLGSRTG